MVWISGAYTQNSRYLILIETQVSLHFGDILDPYFILNVLRSHMIDEIYHFAAQSHVGVSWELQLYTSDVTALGTLRIIQAISTLELQTKVKFYNVRYATTHVVQYLTHI